MKKLFTLVAVALMACGAYAQGTYAVQDGDVITSGLQITSVPNITMTWSETEEAWNKGKKAQNWVVEDLVAYANGATSGKFKEGSEPTGCMVKFEPKVAGTLTVGVQLSPNKALYIVNKDFSKVADYTYNFPEDADATESQVLTQNDKGEDIIPADGKKSNGAVTFAVEAGGVYYVVATGTKAGFFGFVFETEGGDSGVSGVTVSEQADKDAPVYNLSGQRVSKDTKGILIQNGKKYVNK